ncbi:TetR/AcrR family transcriptional regulator [Nonomuraea indica]|uniref:TetR/AcrR family transcriptional regulator n=1 Tax=Nonomuraea indica TaxID=1581193 RepID=A0ABW8A687_9ACTN
MTRTSPYVGSVTMRKVAEHLGVEAMSLHHHVADKDEILDGIVDLDRRPRARHPPRAGAAARRATARDVN